MKTSVKKKLWVQICKYWVLKCLWGIQEETSSKQVNINSEAKRRNIGNKY